MSLEGSRRGVAEVLRVLPQDRNCPGWLLDNRWRRRFAPPEREVRRLDVRPGMTVADLGCGVGYHVGPLTASLQGKGRLYCCDVDRQNLARAELRPRNHAEVSFFPRSATSVPEIPSDSVDRALLSLVICCLVDKEGAMEEVWRILRPGGRALVTYPRTGLRWGRRRRAWVVTRERWAGLMSNRPWTELQVRSGWLVARHYLEKPDGAS
jgi:SAM-dependent methyltransferase